MFDFSLLPKDIRIEICKKMDMDTRIKMGYVQKLNIDPSVRERLSRVLGDVNKSVGTLYILHHVDLKDKYCLMYGHMGKKRWDVYEIGMHVLYNLCDDKNVWSSVI